jgi:hypothetical protein
MMCLIVCLMVRYAPAQDTVVFTSEGTAPGSYHYVMTVAQDGTISVQLIEGDVIQIGGGVPPPPPPPPTDVRAKVKKWTLEVNDPDLAKTAKAVAVVYRQTGKLAEDGSAASVDQLQKATDLLYGTAMRLAGKEAVWTGWKVKVDSLAPAAVPDAAQVWFQIAEGLEDAVEETLKAATLRGRLDELHERAVADASCEIVNRVGLFQ